MKRKADYIRQGYRQMFKISMKNCHIDMMSGEISENELVSDYTRTIYQVPEVNLGFAKYQMNSTYYKQGSNGEAQKWSFASGTEFYHSLYCIEDEEYRHMLYNKAEKESPYPTLEESFQKYPKLPSVYLLVMQALDIISLDSYLSVINSEFREVFYSMEYKREKDLSNQKVKIGAGIYTDSSNYYNKDFRVRLSGNGSIEGENCYLYEYEAAPSDVFMEKAGGPKQKHKSLYSGCLCIGDKTGELIYGEMAENVVPVGNPRRYTRRKITLKNKGEEI